MAQKRSKHVAIEGSTYKNAIVTFGITYDNQFLPIQLIYGGKTLQSLPRFEFPKAFLLSTKKKHFGNSTESLKFIDEISIPYVSSQRKRKELDVNHPALLFTDVFKWQVMDPVLLKLRENTIFLARVSPNTTNFFRPLDRKQSYKSLIKEKIYRVVQ